MTGLPEQEPAIPLTERLYTPDDVQHLLAREMAKRQLKQVEDGLLETNKKLLEVVSGFNAELKALREMIAAQPQKVEMCKSELRAEIDREFQTALAAERMEHRIEDRIEAVNHKVDRQWLKITMTLGTLSAVITGVGVTVNYLLMVRQIAGS